MLKIMDEEYFAEVLNFAKEVGAEKEFQYKIDYLDTYACADDKENTICELSRDFAPHSFFFVLKKKTANGYEPWFHGGMIYHFYDGMHEWSIHT